MTMDCVIHVPSMKLSLKENVHAEPIMLEMSQQEFVSSHAHLANSNIKDDALNVH